MESPFCSAVLLTTLSPVLKEGYPFMISGNQRSLSLLELPSIDMCGPFAAKSPGGSWHLMVVVDGHSGKTTVCFLKCKSGTVEALIASMTRVETHP